MKVLDLRPESKEIITDEVTIYPGHEDKTTMKEEKKNNLYLNL